MVAIPEKAAAHQGMSRLPRKNSLSDFCCLKKTPPRPTTAAV
jgi:hypothetical protein